jgi:tetratricopeptide (TPR) repeat protein
VTKEDHYNEGMELFAQDKLDEAVLSYQRALQEDPNYVDALHALVMTYAHQEKLDEAIEVGKKLIEVAPDDELAYTSLSIFYQQKGMIAEAEQIGAQARTLGWKRQLKEKNTS